MDGCLNYTVLSGADRAQGNILQNDSFDWDLAPGWYRFQGAAGDQMADKCVLSYRCGTWHPGWLSGAHPTVDEGVVARKVCYTVNDNCCTWSNNITVKNCSSYYVYELQKPPFPYLRYCGNAGAGKLHFVGFFRKRHSSYAYKLGFTNSENHRLLIILIFNKGVVRNKKRQLTISFKDFKHTASVVTKRSNDP